VTGQPLVHLQGPDPAQIDEIAITRKIRPTLTFGAQGIYFAGDHVGLLGEAQLIGLGFEDSCALRTASGSVRNQQVCAHVNNAETSASAVLVGAGIVYRVSSRQTVSPYVRAGLGAVFSTRSSVLMIGEFQNVDGEPVQVEIYPDEATTRLTGSATVGLGFTAVIGRGYQVRWEVMDRIVGVRGVSGPTVQDGLPPPTSISYRHLFAIQIGFDVVLERRRGRRY
jgi:hypothetical protein